MKRIYFSRVLLLVAVVSSAASCSKDFLDVKLQGQETLSSDPNLANLLVIGAYNSLLQGDSFANGDVHGFAFISATNIMSDDADKGSYALDQATTTGQMDEFEIAPSNTFCNTLWLGHYNGIGAVNQTLKAFASAKNIPVKTLSGLKGEVLFIRGMLYFDLVRMFGGVPLVTHVPTDPQDALTNPVYTTRAAIDVVYDSILADLHYASAHLPAGGQIGHASKGSAQALMAKVYLYQKNWDMALAMSDSVINSGIYSLEADYGKMFRQAGQNGTESIFEIQTGKFNNGNFGIANFTNCQGPRVGGLGGWNDLGWGFNDPTTTLVNAYEPGDSIRKASTIIFIDTSVKHHGTVLWDGFRIPSSDSVQNLRYNYKTYTSSTTPSKESYAVVGDKDQPQNVPVLRYADVLLMNSEAAFMSGKGDPAFGLNAVRARAKLAPKSGITLADIKQERHVELAMEDDRFWDLVRWGDAETVMHAAGKPNYQSNRNELLPIPSIQIQLSNGKLKQNPGYPD